MLLQNIINAMVNEEKHKSYDRYITNLYQIIRTESKLKRNSINCLILRSFIYIRMVIAISQIVSRQMDTLMH